MTATESLYAGMNAGGGITIADSKVDVASGQNNSAIFTPKALAISGTSQLSANGDDRAM